MHPVTFEAVEYFPMSHRVHLVAPVPVAAVPVPPNPPVPPVPPVPSLGSTMAVPPHAIIIEVTAPATSQARTLLSRMPAA